MLEKANQRSRALGISNTAVSEFPMIDNKNSSSNINTLSGACATTMASQQQQKPTYTTASFDGSSAIKSKLHVIEKHNDKESVAAEPQKVLRQFSAVDKENMDLGIEINIVTDKNVEVCTCVCMFRKQKGICYLQHCRVHLRFNFTVSIFILIIPRTM